MGASSPQQGKFKTALFNASSLHIAIGLYKLILVPWLSRLDGSVGSMRRFRYRAGPDDDNPDAALEHRQYALFIVVYGAILAMYNEFGSPRMQKVALAIETFRVSCYVFVNTMDSFDFDDELSGEKFIKQLWDLVGLVGLLGHVCAVCDEV